MFTSTEQVFINFLINRDKVALRDSLDSPGITFGDMNILSGRIYAWLKKNGYGKEDVIMIHMPRSAKIVIALQGVWRAGCAVTICETSMPEERYKQHVTQCKPKLVIDEALYQNMMLEETLSGAVYNDPHDLAAIVYSDGRISGTGRAAMLEFGILDKMLEGKYIDGQPVFGFDDVVAISSNLSHFSALDYIACCLSFGAEMVIIPDILRTDPNDWAFSEAMGITTVFVPPSFFSLVPKFNSQMKTVILGSEPCSNVYRDDVTVYNAYNMVESSATLGLFKIDRKYDLTPVGQAPKVDVRLQDGSIAPPGVRGRICFKAEFFRGYADDPALTADRITDGYYSSTDLGTRLPDGNLLVLGRIQDIVTVNGKMVELSMIAGNAKKALNLDWAEIRSFQREDGENYLVLYYVDESPHDEKELLTGLAKTLPPHMLPERVVRLDSIPLTSGNALDTSALLEPEMNQFRSEYKAPETALERQLCTLFENALGKTGISVTDDYFTAGVNDAVARQIVKDSDIDELDAHAIYECKTIRNLAARIALLRDEKTFGNLEVDLFARKRAWPLSAYQQIIFDRQARHPLSIIERYRDAQCWRFRKGDVDPQRLRDALLKLIDHHPVLKTIISYNEKGQVVQHYDPLLRFNVSCVRVTEPQIEMIKERFVTPIELLNGPLYRMAVIEAGDYIYMFIDFHVICSDLYSSDLFIDNLEKAYRGEKLPYDYYYYHIAEDTKSVKDRAWIESKEYYEKLYADGTDWTTMFTPDAVPTGFDNARSYTFKLIEDLPAFYNMLKQNNMSARAFCAASMLIMMSVIENANDVMLTWIYPARSQASRQLSLGCYCQPVPLALKMDEVSSLSALFHSVTDQLNKNIEHCNYPFLSEETAAFRAARKTPYILTLVTKAGSVAQQTEILGVPLEKVELPKVLNANNQPISMTFGEDNSGLITFNYDGEYYTDEFVVRLSKLMIIGLNILTRFDFSSRYELETLLQTLHKELENMINSPSKD